MPMGMVVMLTRGRTSQDFDQQRASNFLVSSLLQKIHNKTKQSKSKSKTDSLCAVSSVNDLHTHVYTHTRVCPKRTKPEIIAETGISIQILAVAWDKRCSKVMHPSFQMWLLFKVRQWRSHRCCLSLTKLTLITEQITKQTSLAHSHDLEDM